MANTVSRDWYLTQEVFDSLLLWLHPDRRQAGEIYENIRAGLITFFECHGCVYAQECADDTINRATRRISEGAVVRPPNPYSYFHGVARNVLREYWKSKERKVETLDDLPAAIHPASDPTEAERAREEKMAREQELKCLEHCIGNLPDDTRTLLLEYYQQERVAQSDESNMERRIKMAERIGITINALRLRIHRLSERLEQCVDDCVSGGRGSGKK